VRAVETAERAVHRMRNLEVNAYVLSGLNGFCLVHSEDPAGARLGTQDMPVTTDRLADNAIGFFCCHCAGGSASDPSPVSAALARRRIEAYSSTVMRIGGSGYFSGVNEEALVGGLVCAFGQDPG